MMTGSKTIYQKKKKFVEELSLLIEEKGHPRIAGQIIGWLLICDPPQQSFSDLVDQLNVSKASISNMTRMLVRSGIIEKVRLQNERQIHFQIKEHAWSDLLYRELQLTRSMRDIANKGLDILGNQTKDKRLKDMSEFYTFAANNLPSLIKKYKKEKINDK